MTDLDVETLQKQRRERVLEMINWRDIVSKWCIEEYHIPPEVRDSVPEQVTTREDAAYEIYENTDLTYTEVDEIIDHALTLGLISTANNGNLVYVPEYRGEPLW